MNATTYRRLTAFVLSSSLSSIAALLVGCAAPQQSAGTKALPLEQAITTATDALALQSQKLPAFIAKLDKRALVIDPMIESGSGRQTTVTQQIEDKVAARLASNDT